MVLKLNAKGEVVNGAGQVVPEAEVRRKVGEILAGNPGQGLTIQADRATTFGNVIKLLTMVQELGGKDVRTEGVE